MTFKKRISFEESVAGFNMLTLAVLLLKHRLYFCFLYFLNSDALKIIEIIPRRRQGPDYRTAYLNTLRPRQNGRHFPDDAFKCIFLNENVWISIKISLKFVSKGPINNIPALVHVMAWRRPGDKPLYEPMMVRLPTHICVTRHQWVNCYIDGLV